MEIVEEPQRLAWKMDEERLLKLERFPRAESKPTELNVDEIVVLPALFQPRGESLTFNPGASRKHVEEMARAVRRGTLLDPLTVVTFGSERVLVDGHHRRAAYIEAGYTGPLPVRVEDSPFAGAERVRWAVKLSLELNSKNKLPMSDRDKFDAAWRLVVQDELSKSELVKAVGVGDGTIGNMRRARGALTGAGYKTVALRAMSWPRARFEYKRLIGDESAVDPEAHENRLRHVAKHLKPILNGRVPAILLLEAMERLRPGISTELETAIDMAKELDVAEEAEAS